MKVLFLFKVKKGAELTDSLYVNFKNESGILTPEIITTEKIEILNISPNSFILDK